MITFTISPKEEPVLFARSIRENIVLGLSNPKKVAGELIPFGGPTMSDDKLQDLAKKANAHDFISRMTQGARLVGVDSKKL